MPSVFVYPQITNPYSGSIADLLLRKGDIAAQAARDIGQIQGNAQQQVGQIWGNATNQVGQAVAQPLEQMADPRRQLAQQQVDANNRALGYQTTATKIAQALVGPDGQQPDPDKASRLMTVAGIPIDAQQPIIQSLQKMADHHKEAMADAGHIAYRIMNTLPKEATDDDRAHAAAVGLGAAKAQGIVNDEGVQAVTSALANGANPKGMALGFMGLSPSGRYKETIQDETKPLILAGAREGGSPSQAVTPQGAVIATGAPAGAAKPTVASLALEASGGDAQTALDAISKANHPNAPAPKSLQRASVLLDGKPAEVQIDPDPASKNPVLDLNGQPIANAAGRIKPIPPASIQIHNMNAQAPNLPEWATDDSRPSGPEGNKLDPVARMTPNGLYQAAITNIATGQMPPTGRGTDPVAVAQRAAIQSKVGAIAASAGMDVPQLRAFFKANQASLTQEQKQYDAAQANITTADRNVAQLEKALEKIPDIGMPIFNKPLRAFATSVVGDKDMAPIATYLASVQNEYGKLINSSNGGAVLTDSARHEAQQLINPDATVAQMLGSIQALKTEGNNRLVSIGDQIQRIQSRMTIGQGGGTNQSAGVPDAVTAALKGQKAGRYTLSDGSIWIVNASGGISAAK